MSRRTGSPSRRPPAITKSFYSVCAELAKWERLSDQEFRTGRNSLLEASNRYTGIAPLPDVPDRVYAVPSGTPTVRLNYRGLPLDAVEDLLTTSRAYVRLGGSFRTAGPCHRTAVDPASRRSCGNFKLQWAPQWRFRRRCAAPCGLLGKPGKRWIVSKRRMMMK